MTPRKLLRTQDYIDHMIEAISRIEQYVKELDQTSFAGNELIQDAVIRNIEVIGEAANKIFTVDNDFAGKNRNLRLDEAYRDAKRSQPRLSCDQLGDRMEHAAK